VHDKTWARRGHTPVVERPGQRQSISAASAVTAKGGFWFATYPGGLDAELFIKLLKKLMKGRRKPLHLVINGLPAHKTASVREYVASTQGKLSLHVLPGHALDLNPDELVWSRVKRTGVACNPLRAGEKLEIRIEEQLRDMQKNRRLIRSFFRAPDVAHIFES
jgi:transposase